MKRAADAASVSYIQITRPLAPVGESVGDLLLPLFPQALDDPKARAGLEIIGQFMAAVIKISAKLT